MEFSTQKYFPQKYILKKKNKFLIVVIKKIFNFHLVYLVAKTRPKKKPIWFPNKNKTCC